MPGSLKTRNVIGYPIAVTTYADATSWSMEAAHRGDRAYAVSAANTHVLAHARHDQLFGEALSKFDLICPDGTPLLWSVNAQLPEEEKLEERVYGPTLMLELLKSTEGDSDQSHFFLGGKQETLDQLSERFESNEIAGTYSPPFGEWPAEEHEKIKALIRESGARFVWVGLGCPKQEKWITDHLVSLANSLRAPSWNSLSTRSCQVRRSCQTGLCPDDVVVMSHLLNRLWFLIASLAIRSLSSAVKSLR